MELARELTELHPSLPVMIVSGSIISDDLSREMETRNWTFSSKPCRLPELAVSLRLTLQAKRGLITLGFYPE